MIWAADVQLEKDSAINYDVGIDRMMKLGECVKKNSPLARIHAISRVQADAAIRRIQSAFEISTTKPKIPPLIAEIILR